MADKPDPYQEAWFKILGQLYDRLEDHYPGDVDGGAFDWAKESRPDLYLVMRDSEDDSHKSWGVIELLDFEKLLYHYTRTVVDIYRAYSARGSQPPARIEDGRPATGEGTAQPAKWDSWAKRPDPAQGELI